MYTSLGHFPWLVSLLNAAFSYTEAGKSLEFIKKVAMDLIKARRESGQGDKVITNNIIDCSPDLAHQEIQL